MSEKQARWRMRCVGKVQRVGFRYTACYLAKEFGLTGWVRNLTDGSVQMEAQGEPALLRQFLTRLKSQPHLHIEKTEIEEIPLVAEESGFSARSKHALPPSAPGPADEGTARHR